MQKKNSFRTAWQSIYNHFTSVIPLAIHRFPRKIKQINEGNQSLERSKLVTPDPEVSVAIKSLRLGCENRKCDLVTLQIKKKRCVSSLDSLIPQVAKCPVFVRDVWRFDGSTAAREAKLLFHQTTSVSVIDSKTNNTPPETLLA